jgi:ketosteroid isomerase-like protein
MVLAGMKDQTASREVELLRSIYRAFNQRDFESVLKMMHADVDWPNALEGTRLHGREPVREYWKRQLETLDPIVEPQGFSSEPDNRIAVNVHQLVRDKSGKVMVDQMIDHVYTIRDGLIRSMEIRNPKN